MDDAHTRTLERALQVVKSKERLAAALGVPLTDLDSYMAGDKRLSAQAYITALDIVAKGQAQP